MTRSGVVMEESLWGVLSSHRDTHYLSRQPLQPSQPRDNHQPASECRTWEIPYMRDGQEGAAGCVPLQLSTNQSKATSGQWTAVCYGCFFPVTEHDLNKPCKHASHLQRSQGTRGPSTSGGKSNVHDSKMLKTDFGEACRIAKLAVLSFRRWVNKENMRLECAEA